MPARLRPATNPFPLLLAGILAALSHWLDLATRVPDVARDGKLRHDPDTIVENFEVRRFDAQGTLRHTLTAGRMVHYPDDDSATVFAPHITWHRPPPTMISAREAHVSSRAERIELIDDVRITRAGVAGKPETTLTTARMDVWPDDELARTSLPVTITQGASRIHGEGGLSVDQKSLVYVLEGPVTGVFFRSPRAVAPATVARPAPPSQPPAAAPKPRDRASSNKSASRR
ncbi:MAG: LPS export ABC transporter periplasmic protein LptC [Rhodocyclaceae bacterium]